MKILVLPHKKSKVYQKAPMDADVDTKVPKTGHNEARARKNSLQEKLATESRSTSVKLNTDPHDSNLQCHEENTSIRYSRRMPVFPPVSSSHANAHPVISNQCRISLVGEGGGKKARFSYLTSCKAVNIGGGKTLVGSSKIVCSLT